MDIVTTLETNNLILAISLGILGLIVGSFLNVVIHRLPIILKKEYEQSFFEYLRNKISDKSKTLNLAVPTSHCPKCKSPITWWQNIPVLSFILLKGRCHACNTPINPRYLVVEILSCIAGIFVALAFGPEPKTLALLVLTWSLIAATFIDIEHQLLPDNITIPLIWLGLLLNTNYIFTSPQNAIIGAVVGYLFLWSIAKAFKLIRKIDGMGHGDFKLLSVFGAWLGWQYLPSIILSASILGLIIGVGLVLLKKHKFSKPLPFGPYLAIAGLGTFFYGNIFTCCHTALLG